MKKEIVKKPDQPKAQDNIEEIKKDLNEIKTLLEQMNISLKLLVDRFV
jgi:hypothetical protein